MRVREAQAGDAAGVAELLTQLGAAGVDTEEAGRRLERGRETIYVAEDGRGLEGLLAIKEEFYIGHARPLGQITALVTHHRARRSGVARKLLQAAVGHARAQDWTGIELTCGLTPAREAAHVFYAAQGFARTSYRYWLPLEGAVR